MKKIAILTIVLTGCFSYTQAQVKNITTSPAYDNVHLEHSAEKSMRHNTKYSLIRKNEVIPNDSISVFKVYPDLSNHTMATFPNREEYIRNVHLHNYLKSDFK